MVHSLIFLLNVFFSTVLISCSVGLSFLLLSLSTPKCYPSFSVSLSTLLLIIHTYLLCADFISLLMNFLISHWYWCPQYLCQYEPSSFQLNATKLVNSLNYFHSLSYPPSVFQLATLNTKTWSLCFASYIRYPWKVPVLLLSIHLQHSLRSPISVTLFRISHLGSHNILE